MIFFTNKINIVMKKQAKLYPSLIAVAVVTLLLLSVPLVAMQFTPEVSWGLFDFIIMGALISGTGIAYVLLSRQAPGIIYRIAMAAALGTTFLMIWANLAVGLIGSGPNAGNLMYGVVVFVAIIGVILSRFKPAGMERAMYSAVIALGLLTAVALLTGMQHYPGSSATEIIGVSGFFAGLYLVTGSLFRYAAKQSLQRHAR